MTKDEILDAALRAWGRDYFKKTSLSDLSAELGVTKAALYRHFPSKAALVSALESRFFDEYARRLVESPLSARGDDEQAGEIIHFVYDLQLPPFAEDKDLFSFFFYHILHGPASFGRIATELEGRGIPIERTHPRLGGEGAALGFAYLTGMFALSVAYMQEGRSEGLPRLTGAEALVAAREVTRRGLALAADPPCDYPALEAIAALSPGEAGPDQPLLEAVAQAVAQAGLRNATMDMVAARAGLSKSGLYAHFRSREEALGSMFAVEFDRISRLGGERASRASSPAAKVFLSMATTANYLRARPDILGVMRWLFARRIDVRLELPKRIAEDAAFLLREAAAGRCSLIGGSLDLSLRWMHYLVVDLVLREMATGEPAPPNAAEDLRALHRLVIGGIGRECRIAGAGPPGRRAGIE